MNLYYADFHIHVGISESGRWVKIPTSRRLTVRTILETALQRKGIQIVGIVDALSPWVQEDIQRLVDEGALILQTGGGYLYHNGVTLILGAEIETCEEGGGMCHSLSYLPDLQSMRSFSREMSGHIRNIGMSSQNAHMTFRRLLEIVVSHEALFVPAHVFTPYKSLFGVCTRRLSGLLSEAECSHVAAIELGLSADSEMADQIKELWGFEFLTNSDAHSPEKIGREYNLMEMSSPSYEECVLAFRRKTQRRIVENYGMDPRLGKYHNNCCDHCGMIFQGSLENRICPGCGSVKMIKGVSERIADLADVPAGIHPEARPSYHYQAPLQMLPGIGGKTLDKLVDELGTEMNLIHQVPLSEIQRVAGHRAAAAVSAVRAGTATVRSGGGGVYGRIFID
jgi:uncharacterized protein (TIGR00375 family)